MKHSTNYINTFIEIAEDSKHTTGIAPPLKGDKKTVAYLQFEIISKNPYSFTSDDVLFSVFAQRKDFTEGELANERIKYFSKGQPCFRASPLTKLYGWGLHSNEEGKIALFGAESEAYEQFVNNGSLKKVKAMKSKRK